MQQCPECDYIYDESEYSKCPRCYPDDGQPEKVIVFDREKGEAIIVSKSEAWKYTT